mgnify:CR=1 FL=1
MSTSLMYHSFGMTDCYYKKNWVSCWKNCISHGGQKIVPFAVLNVETGRFLQRELSKEHLTLFQLVWNLFSLLFQFRGSLASFVTLSARLRYHFQIPKSGIPKKIERYVLYLSKHVTIKDGAAHTNISWNVIKDIQKRKLSKKAFSTIATVLAWTNLERARQASWWSQNGQGGTWRSVGAKLWDHNLSL